MQQFQPPRARLTLAGRSCPASKYLLCLTMSPTPISIRHPLFSAHYLFASRLSTPYPAGARLSGRTLIKTSSASLHVFARAQRCLQR